MTLQTALIIAVGTLLSLTFDLARSDDSGRAALLIIDMQDCFTSGGSLEVPGGNDVIEVINSIRDKHEEDLSLVALSQDWHPNGHVSFASSYPGTISPVDLQYDAQGHLCTSTNITVTNFPDAVDCTTETSQSKELQQALWPDHCIQNVSSGPVSSAFVSGLNVKSSDIIIHKGTNLEIDSYSAFFDNGGSGETKLNEELKEGGITHVFVTGLAGDICVYFTSLDAKTLGYETYYVVNATSPVDPSSYQEVINDLVEKGVHVIQPDGIAKILKDMVKSASPRLPSLSLPSILALGWLVKNL